MTIRIANGVVAEATNDETFYIWVLYRGWVLVKKEKEIPPAHGCTNTIYLVKEVGRENNGYRVFCDDLAYIESKDKE